MLIRIFIKFILGYVRIAVEGYYIERFINICTNENILIWSIKRENDVKIYANIGINDFKNISKIAKKTKCRIKLEAKFGLPFIFNRYRKRKIFVVLLIIFFLGIFISSNYIWNIEIIEEGEVQTQNIKEELKEAGLETGKLKFKIDTKDIINKIRLKRDDIAWMGIELKGTNAIVNIIKADKSPEIFDETEHCNIVSNKNGMIIKINAHKGTPRVKVGDVVQNGDILIEGVMEGKYTEPRYTHATGEIEAKVWYTKSQKIYFKQEIEEYTGKEEKNYGIKINNFKIFFPKGVSKFKLYDTIETENKIKIFSNLYLPISVIKTTNNEIKKQEKSYNLDEAIALGKQELEKRLDEEITDKESILRQKHKYKSRKRICRSKCNL